MDARTQRRSLLRRAGAGLAALLGMLALPAAGAAAPHFEWSATLPFTGGLGQTLGDLVAHDGGATAFYSVPDGNGLRLFLYRFGADGTVLLAREVGAPGEIHYEPGACWDGARYAVAASSFTRANFLLLSADGDAALPPLPLPGIPFGGRTAAFRVRCTPAGYAVFGLLLEPEFVGSPFYYTRLHYWRIDGAGTVQVDRDLGILLAPIAYPGLEGAEKEYYDVVWTGNGFLVAYSAECGVPASFQTCYRVLDVAGDTVRPEAPATTVPTKGPHLAASGAGIGLATLRQNAFPGGNHLFARFFDADGTPRGPEQRYDDPVLAPTGYAPAIVWASPRFLAAYVQADPFTLAYQVMLAPFDGAGTRLDYGAPVLDPGSIVNDTVNLGIDLQLAAGGPALFGKGQAGVIEIAPIVFRIPEPDCAPLAGAAALALAGAGAAAGQRRRSASRSSAARWPAAAAPSRVGAASQSPAR